MEDGVNGVDGVFCFPLPEPFVKFDPFRWAPVWA